MRFLWMSVCVLACGCAGTPRHESSLPKSFIPIVEMGGSIDELSQRAMLGDVVAAAQLSNYFRYAKNMDPRWKRWAQIGAENGDPRAMFDMYNILVSSPDKLKQMRSFYWLRKSAVGGFAFANLELKRCFPTGTFEGHKAGCVGPGGDY